MRPRSIVLLLIALTAAGAVAGDLTEMLGSPKPDRYAMADGAVLLISRDANHDVLKAADGQTVVELRENEVLAEAVQSANKKFLLCRLQTHRGVVKKNTDSRSLGFDFSGLARISHDSTGWLFQRVWKVDGIEWVRDLGAMSDDGHRALFRVGRKSAPVAPYSVGAEWETWDLDKNVLIKTGLSIE